MKIIFGLGNPGQKYVGTRHNCGFMTLDLIAEKLGCCFGRLELDNDVAVGRYGGEKVLLAKPQQFMNLSGFPLVRLCSYYKVDYTDILVILDDLDLAPGTIRLRSKGRDGGHNGMKSIIAQTGTEQINRLKIGIGKAQYDTIDHVLTPFSPEEKTVMQEAFARGAEAALCWVKEGISEAMNLFNRKTESPAAVEK